MTEESKGLSRRTLMKGAAWAVPVVAVAAAVPAYAASGQTVIGEFYESSANITNQTVNMSAFYINCTDGTTTPWAGQPFTVTITISYTGSNADFTFDPTVNQNPAWAMNVTPTQITLTTTATPQGCGTGATEFPAISLFFNPNNVDPGPDSISVQGSAVSQDGQYTVSPLIDTTPCSPTYGQSPIVGPRDIPNPCNP